MFEFCSSLSSWDIQIFDVQLINLLATTYIIMTIIFPISYRSIIYSILKCNYMYVSYNELLGLLFVCGTFWALLKVMMLFFFFLCSVMSHIVSFAFLTKWNISRAKRVRKVYQRRYVLIFSDLCNETRKA